MQARLIWIGCLALGLTVSGCDGKFQLPEARGVRDLHSLHGLGAAASPPVESAHARTLASSAVSTAPQTFDLSQYNPPVGDQSWIGSCVSWAEGWTYAGWLARKAGQSTTFAPMYLYSQVDQGQAETGSSLDAPLQILQYQGVDSWDDYDRVVPALNGADAAGYNYLNNASGYPDAVAGAATNKAVSWQYEYDQGNVNCGGSPGASAAIRDAISQGRPVVLGLPVYPEFDAYGADSPPVPVPGSSEASRGLHAVFAARYDEQGVWIQNQWGTGWGKGGTGELSWAFVEQCVWGVVSMQGLVAGQVNQASITTVTPTAGATVTGAVTIQVHTTDGLYPIEGVSVLVDGTQTLWASRGSTGDFTAAWNTTLLPNGPHTLVPTAHWNGGTLQGDSIPVTVSNQGAPISTVTVTFASPAADAWVRGTTAVSISATAASAGESTVEGGVTTINSISLSVDQGKPSMLTGSSVSFTLDTSGLADGRHTLQAVATASDGSQGSATRTFTSDNTPPSIAITAPLANATLSGKTALSATAQDAQGTVPVVSYYANDTLLATVQGGPAGAPGYAFSWDTTATPDGTYALVARATDNAGNIGSSAAVQVTVANQAAPAATVTLTSPTGGSILSGGVNVVAAVTSGTALSSLALYLDGQPTASAASPLATQWYWDTTQVPDGEHTLQVKGTDVAGRPVFSSEVRVTVSNAWLGLVAQYYGDQGLQQLKLERNDANIDFNWGTGAPDPALGTDHFSIRWSGSLLAPATGAYHLYTESDDGVRVWVNDTLVIDNWTDHAATENSVTVQLAQGQPTAIRVEYYEDAGDALMQLLWDGPGMAKQTIPRSALRQPDSFPTLTLLASGTPDADVYPNMQLSIGGVPLQTWTVTGDVRSYALKIAPDTLTLGKARVAFTNDAYDPPQDRNLNVQSLSVGSTVYRTTDASTYMSSCSSGYLQSPWLDCNGFFEFATVPGAAGR